MRSADDDVAYITGSVLRWARERSGLSLEVAAENVRAAATQLKDWEDGGSNPPFKTAQALATLFHIPFGFLFLPKPPQSELPLPDFRKLDRNFRHTPNFLELLNDILVKQDWYRDYAGDSGDPSLKFVSRFTVNSSVSEVAISVRRTLNINQALRQSVRSWSEYLSAISRNAEDAGILVFRSSIVGNATRRKVSFREVQGFAVADPKAPLVFVNSEDSKASQIFTMAHELAHLWIGQSAISNPDETEAGRDVIESFCNRVAAETLVPEDEFARVWQSGNEEAVIGKIARWFLVSTLVILRRALELDKISIAKFQELKRSEIAKQNRVISSGGDYYRNVVARMGGRLTYAVLGEVQHRRILLRDASRLLNMSIPTLLKFAERAR